MEMIVQQECRIIPGEGVFIDRGHYNYYSAESFLRSDNYIEVNFGSAAERLCGSMSDSGVPVSDVLMKAWEMVRIISSALGGFIKQEHSLESAITSGNGVCIDESIIAALFWNKLSGRHVAAIEGGEIISDDGKNRHFEGSHAWCILPDTPLIVDVGMRIVGIPVKTNPDTYYVFANETMPSALRCHTRICEMLEKSIAEDSKRRDGYYDIIDLVSGGELIPDCIDHQYSGISKQMIRDANTALKINQCHIRIFNNLTAMMWEKAGDKSVLPLEYKAIPKTVAVDISPLMRKGAAEEKAKYEKRRA